MDWGLAIAAGTLELVILSSAIGVVWKLTRTEINLRAEANLQVAAIRADAAKEIATLTTKVYQIEIWARDEFVRKGSFELVVTRLEKSMDLLGAKVEASIDKMATRMENMQHHRE